MTWEAKELGRGRTRANLEFNAGFNHSVIDHVTHFIRLALIGSVDLIESVKIRLCTQFFLLYHQNHMAEFEVEKNDARCRSLKLQAFTTPVGIQP